MPQGAVHPNRACPWLEQGATVEAPGSLDSRFPAGMTYKPPCQALIGGEVQCLRSFLPIARCSTAPARSVARITMFWSRATAFAKSPTGQSTPPPAETLALEARTLSRVRIDALFNVLAVAAVLARLSHRPVSL